MNEIIECKQNEMKKTRKKVGEELKLRNCGGSCRTI